MLAENREISYHSARTLCSKILESNFMVRSAAICRDDGTIVCSDHRQSHKPLAAHAEGQASLIRASSRFFNRKINEKSFGKVTYSLTLHEKVARIAVPLHDKYVVLVSADKDTNHTDLIMRDIYPVVETAKI
jgi:hypothetical protein